MFRQLLYCTTNIFNPIPDELFIAEVAELSMKMDAINAALDTLEQRSESMASELRKILRENKEAREIMQQEQQQQQSH